MYTVELSAAALADLDDFSDTEIQEILSILLKLEEPPRPAEVQAIPLAEAADRMAFWYETDIYSIFYDVFEISRVVKVVAIFQKISFN